MSYIDELKDLLNVKETTLTLAEFDNIEVYYVGKVTQVNEETDRFVFTPKTVITTIDGIVYETNYTRAVSPGYDIDNVKRVNVKQKSIELKQ